MLATGPTEASLSIGVEEVIVRRDEDLNQPPFVLPTIVNLAGNLVVLCNSQYLYQLPGVGCGLLDEATTNVEAGITMIQVEPSLNPKHRTKWEDPDLEEGVYVNSSVHCNGCDVRDEKGCDVASHYEDALKLAKG